MLSINHDVSLRSAIHSCTILGKDSRCFGRYPQSFPNNVQKQLVFHWLWQMWDYLSFIFNSNSISSLLYFMKQEVLRIYKCSKCLKKYKFNKKVK